MNFTDCVTCTSHILLPIGSLLRSHNEIFNPEGADITHMFCRHCDNGRVYRCQRLGEETVRAEALGRFGREEMLYTKRDRDSRRARKKFLKKNLL